MEARSLVAQEALLLGRPLVASAVGGLPELLGEGARLVPAHDVNALDAAVRLLLTSPRDRADLAERGRARAAGWPTPDDTVAQVAAVYQELTGVAD
jgi:glycosyltransferase involved in cell wall biosynthesis